MLSLSLLASGLCPAFPRGCSHGGASPTPLDRLGSEMEHPPQQSGSVCLLGGASSGPGDVALNISAGVETTSSGLTP